MSFLHKDAVEVVIIYNGPGGSAVWVPASTPWTPPPRPQPPPLSPPPPPLSLLPTPPLPPPDARVADAYVPSPRVLQIRIKVCVFYTHICIFMSKFVWVVKAHIAIFFMKMLKIVRNYLILAWISGSFWQIYLVPKRLLRFRIRQNVSDPSGSATLLKGTVSKSWSETRYEINLSKAAWFSGQNKVM